ncbi:MAG: phosphoribosylaminoimidazolesuccinocarboxamide synthase [Armatimonadota bacterium]|nr:MAG: phosphoribosylaminoimidazolesuccinocarboxamide synthase [Armatimonadota bacterium]
MGNQALLHTNLPEVPLFNRGKVRDIYDLGEHLLIVATDRISAFDVVMPNGIPDKGRVLTGLSLFWCHKLGDITPHHVLETDVARYPDPLPSCRDQLAGRSMLVRKTSVLPVECVVRGYAVLGSAGWKEYREKGSICGIALAAGLQESQQLPEPIFTPTTKAQSGHDENITASQAADIVGEDAFRELRDRSVAIYRFAADYARERGIIVADTKFEFGVASGGEIVLIDEVLTPDSSRFWDVQGYRPGVGQDSFDKQYVRDYLETVKWDKEPPAPELPPEVVARTREKYLEAYRRLVGEALDVS